MTNALGVARDQLRAFIERIERLEEEKKTIADDIKDVYGEAKGVGFDTKILRKVIAIRKQDKDERAEQEAILDSYLIALGMIDQPGFFDDEPRQSAPVERQSAMALRSDGGLSIFTKHEDIRTSDGSPSVSSSLATREAKTGRPVGSGEAQKFLRDVVFTYEGDDCLVWPFARQKNGYAQIGYEGRTQIVSRIVCERANGAAPSPDHHAAHSCGNGSNGCVNMRHLLWKSRAENEADKIDHGTACLGERNSQAVLTEDDVAEIRRLRGEFTTRQIGEMFGISRTTVSAIHVGKRWGWLAEESVVSHSPATAAVPSSEQSEGNGSRDHQHVHSRQTDEAKHGGQDGEPAGADHATYPEMDRATEGSFETGSEAAEKGRKATATVAAPADLNHAGAGESPAADQPLKGGDHEVVSSALRAGLADPTSNTGEGVASALPTNPVEPFREYVPPTPMKRLPYAHCFPELTKAEYGQLEFSIIGIGINEPIIRMGDVIVDGWARYNIARSLGIAYPVTSYHGKDVLLDVIEWQRAARNFTPAQEKKIAADLAKEIPHRAGEIMAAFGLAEALEAAE